MFEKGNDYGKGRPPGSKNKGWSVKKLQDSLEKAALLNNGKDFLDHICEKAYNDNQLAIMLLRKLLPDLAQTSQIIEATGFFAHKTPDQICEDFDNTTMGKEEKEDSE